MPIFIFIATLLFLSPSASAQYVLVFSDDFYDYSVDTRSFSNKTFYSDNRAFDVNVEIFSKDNSSTLILRYSLWENDGLIWYSLGQGTGLHPADEPALAIWLFGLHFLNLDYSVSYH